MTYDTTLDQHALQQQQQQQERGTSPPLFESVDDDQVVMDSLNSYAACFCCNPFEDMLPDFVSLQGQAFDLIVVQNQTNGLISSNDFLVKFEHPSFPFPPHQQVDTLQGSSDENQCEALLEVETETLGKIYFPIVHDFVEKKNRLQEPPKCDNMCDRLASTHPPQRQPMERGNTDANLRKIQEQETLKLLVKLLKPGKNPVRYLFRNDKRVLGAATASIFLWSNQDRIVICDVDGTITKSNVRGIYDTIISEKYRYCHDRVCHFLSSLMEATANNNNNSSDHGDCGEPQNDTPNQHQPDEPPPPPSPSNIKVLYLTSRPLFVAHTTRKFLANLRQSPLGGPPKPLRSKTENDEICNSPDADDHRLPEGPLLGFGGNFMDVLKMELLSFKTHLFKASVLMDQVVAPFCAVADDPKRVHESLFVAGFGNTMMDVQAYHMVGMDLSQIYLIDKKSRITCLDKNNHSHSNKDDDKSRNSGTKADSEGTLLMPSEVDVDDDDDDNPRRHRPVLRQPLSKNVYKTKLGTAFQGYHDENLTSHVFSRKFLIA